MLLDALQAFDKVYIPKNTNKDIIQYLKDFHEVKDIITNSETFIILSIPGPKSKMHSYIYTDKITWESLNE